MKKLTAIIFTLTVCLSFFACQPSDKNEDLKPLSVNDGQYLYIEEDYSRGAMVLTESITKEIYERSYKDDKYPNVLIYEENGETFYFQTYITVILKANEISHNVEYKEFERDGNAFTATEIKTDIEGAEKLTLEFSDEDNNGSHETIVLKIKIAGERDFEITIKNKNTNFKTLFPDIKINSADEIKMAKYTSWPGSIAPPWINRIWESTDEAYFQRIVDFIESNPVYKNDELSVGGGGCSLKIYMKDGREFRISGSQIIVNGVDYVLEASIPKPEGDPDKYFIDMPTIIIDYVSYGEATKIESAFLNDIQYVKSDKELDYVDFTKDALIDLNGTYISIVSAKEFYFRGELWQVVSDADYTDYLPKAEDETCFITIMDGDAVYKKVLVSKGQKYSAEEINNALSLYRANLYFEDGHVFAETVVTEDLTLNIEFYTY